MKILFAILAGLGLAACASPGTRAAPRPAPRAAAQAASPYPAPKRDGSRLPLPGDSGFAWDKLSHRGQPRWECRATPSGQFVRQSFCAGLPQREGRRPAAFSSLEGWDGMLHED